MKYFLGFLLVALISSNALAENIDLSDYNIENVQNFDEFSFLPFIGSSRQGAILYSNYEKQILGPATLGYGWQTIVIELSPSAINSSQFDDFIIDNSIIDMRVNLFPEDATLCELTDDALIKFNEINLLYTTNVLTGGYPKACSLQISYTAQAGSDIENILIDYLENNMVLTLNYELIINETVDRSFDFHNIVQDLVTLGGLQESTASMSYYSSISDFTFYARLLDPLLFNEDSISLETWQFFISQFTFNDNTVFITLSDGNQIISIPGSGADTTIFSINQKL